MSVTVSLYHQVQAWLAAQNKIGVNNVDYMLVDHSDGNGTQIGAWDQSKLGPVPTADQLASVATQAAALLAAQVAAAKPKPSPREWLERLSDAKQAAISAAGVGNAAILLWLLKAAGSPVIDVTAAETIAGVGALVQAGVLTADDQTLLLTP